MLTIKYRKYILYKQICCLFKNRIRLAKATAPKIDSEKKSNVYVHSIFLVWACSVSFAEHTH